MQSKDHLSAADSVAPFGSSVGARPTTPGEMWDRFIELRRKNLGVVEVVNLIGSAAAMRDDFISANRVHPSSVQAVDGDEPKLSPPEVAWIAASAVLP